MDCLKAWRVGFISAILMAGGAMAVGAEIYTFQEQFNLAIPVDSTGKGWMEDAYITVPLDGIITDIDISINLTHTNVFDLQIFLESPAGTRIALNYYEDADKPFSGQDYAWTTFDDQAGIGIEEATAPFAGHLRPISGNYLADFKGENALGVWQIQVYDHIYMANGTFLGARLDMVINPEPASLMLFIMLPLLLKTKHGR